MTARGIVLTWAAAAVISACSPTSEGEQPVAATEAARGTVAAEVAASKEHRKLASALTDSQLAPVLDNKGEYTLLAPNDAAFAALGEKSAQLVGQDQRPLMIAVLRGHILPGQVTPKSIEAAIDRKRGPVEMRTMAGTTVTFAKQDDAITVSNGAATARLAAMTTAASNGAVLPIDKVLLPAQ